MPSRTVEDYLKQLYLEQQQHAPGQQVPMGRLAAAAGVVPGTATSMVKALAESGLVVYEPRNGVRLTPSGKRLALHVLRRHRLIELFLVKVLGLDWSEVHEEAEELEHAVSDKVIQRIDALLGHPAVDPHGDPIPTVTGKLPEAPSQSLADCEVGQPFVVARVLDQGAEFLHSANRWALTPGVTVIVEGRDPQGDAVAVRPHGREAITLGTAAAAKILVEEEGHDSK